MVCLIHRKINMLTFSELREDLEQDIVDILKGLGTRELEIDYEEGYVSGEFDTKEQVQKAVDAIPDNVDYEIEVSIDVGGADDEKIETSDDIDEIDFDSLDDDIHTYEIYVYLDNASYDEMDEETDLNERKRVIKVTSKGKRRIKIKCNKGFKYDGRKCVKIGGTEAIKKRKAIKKSVRTKKAKGAGYARKSSRLRKKAMKKRKSMGLS